MDIHLSVKLQLITPHSPTAAPQPERNMGNDSHEKIIGIPNYQKCYFACDCWENIGQSYQNNNK